MRSRKVSIAEGAKSETQKFELSILFIEGEEWWSAQCLEYDIAAQAGTLNELFHEMERVLVSQIALDVELGRKPFEGIGPAPKKYREAFERSETRVERPAEGFKPGNIKQPRFKPTIKVAAEAA